MANHVEAIKAQSAQLRGELLNSLADPLTGSLRESDQTIIKYHGSYQQDDRDQREARREAKLEPDYSFMIRTRTPGGVIQPWQWSKLDAIARRYCTRGLRITSRQALQFHGVIKRELKATMQAINQSLIDTLAACGDVNRNVALAANPHQSAAHAQVYAIAAKLSERLLPSTRAYYEIWLDEEQVAGAVESPDPVYGQQYLPRKFKIGFAIPPSNDVDIYTQDLGFIAQISDGELQGFVVTAGGGMGASHNDPETYPLLAHTLGFIGTHDLEAVALAVVSTQRDFGNRVVRKRARLKYTIEDRGIAWFKTEVEARAGISFQESAPIPFQSSGDQFGWQQSADRQWHLGLRIVAGRIWDEFESNVLPRQNEFESSVLPRQNEFESNVLPRQNKSKASLQTGLLEIAELLAKHSPDSEFRLTPNQNLLLARIPDALKAEVDALLEKHGLANANAAASVLRDAMACVALPTCGLAMAEAERYLPEFAGLLQQLLGKLGLQNEPIQLRMSGCPNGCSRPYVSEIALVGKSLGRYNLHLGGSVLGNRLNSLYRENKDVNQILAELELVLARFKSEREASERFGDFVHRVGIVREKTIPAQVLSA
jgi:sulfite reductase (NADPH) hemoprotein beta-component